MATKTVHNANLTTAEAREIGKDIFLWGMHPGGIYHLRFHQTQNSKSKNFVGLNRMHWDRRPMKALPRLATTPNATTLYGVGMFDVRREPVVISAGDIKDHYWSVQMYDNYARWWHLIGSQFNAPGPVRRFLIGPEWKGNIPPEFVGADIVQSSSNFVGVLGRVALRDSTEAEIATVQAIQDSIRVMPLSQWIAAGKKPVRFEDIPATPANYPTYPGMEAVMAPGRLAGADFMRWVSLVLNDDSFTKQADGHKEVMAFDRFAKVGLAPGKTFDPATLDQPILEALSAGIDDGKQAVQELIVKGKGVIRNGWQFESDLDYKDSDWLSRARNGYIALLAPVPSRSHIGSLCLKDSAGQMLTGKNRYTLTFALNDLPPVTEFWEIPLYDREGYFVDNPIDRYSLNSYMLEAGKLHTENGKLIIYVQKDEPTDANQKKNWLPAPEGGFQFAARFYGAHGPLIDGTYNMPGLVRVD
jgi:hypothetical protein